jgi:hypothetical protein
MEIVNNAEYQKFEEMNKDNPFWSGIKSFAVRWADLMENGIEEGKELKDVAKETEYPADTERITGAMYNSAVNYLVLVWKYGEQLKKWHNDKYGYNGNGVVDSCFIHVAKRNGGGV